MQAVLNGETRRVSRVQQQTDQPTARAGRWLMVWCPFCRLSTRLADTGPRKCPCGAIYQDE